jgi:hypothetical protein
MAVALIILLWPALGVVGWVVTIIEMSRWWSRQSVGDWVVNALMLIPAAAGGPLVLALSIWSWLDPKHNAWVKRQVRDR